MILLLMLMLKDRKIEVEAEKLGRRLLVGVRVRIGSGSDRRSHLSATLVEGEQTNCVKGGCHKDASQVRGEHKEEERP